MLVIFPVLFCFFLLYLELQRSDDDADSALWVCSSAGAAQRYPPSNQKGGTRKHAIPTPHSLWPVGCGPLLTLNQPSSQMPPNLRRNWLLNLAYLSSTLSYSMTNALLPNVFTSQCSHWLLWSLNSPQTPPFLFWETRYWVCASLVLQVFCQGMLVCSCFTWPFSERSSKILTSATSKVAQLSMVHCGGDGGDRHTPARPHGIVAHALQGPSPARSVQHPRLWDIIPT